MADGYARTCRDRYTQSNSARDRLVAADAYEVHISATSGVGNTTEPSICGGDAALCQITLTTCYSIHIILSLIQVKLLNLKTEEEYMFMPIGNAIISWKTSEWLEMPVLQTDSQDMLPCKLAVSTSFKL